MRGVDLVGDGATGVVEGAGGRFDADLGAGAKLKPLHAIKWVQRAHWRDPGGDGDLFWIFAADPVFCGLHIFGFVPVGEGPRVLALPVSCHRKG